MAKAPKSKAAPVTAAENRANRSIGRAAIAIMMAGFVSFFFLSTMLLLICGMAPTIVAYLIDTNPRKYAARTVGVINFAGCMPVAADLWAGGQTVDFAVELLLDPINWLIMLGAAAIGWIMYFVLPPVVGTYLSISFESRIRSEEERQQGLVKEWGTDVAQRAPVDDLAAIEADEKRAAAKAKLKPGADPDGHGDDTDGEEMRSDTGDEGDEPDEDDGDERAA